MNIQEYISSGILESYLLGQLTPAEENEVLDMAVEHPEIQEELDRIASTLESLALQTPVPPPIGLKGNIMNKIKRADAMEEATSPRAKKTISSPSEPNIRNLLIGGLLLALLAFMIAMIILFNCRSTTAALRSNIDAVAESNTQLTQDNAALTQQLDKALEDVRIMASDDFLKVDLQGLPLAPNAYAQVYWNRESQDVYLQPTSLPAPNANQQYQLWAIVDGAPVSMGVFDIPPDSTLIKMASVQNAGAFAITLEPAGGVESPTLDAMHVLGEVSS